jgi:hypothetical protein
METVLNQSADSGAPWWPFAFLKPQQDERFTTPRVAALAILQGVPVALALVLLDHAARHAAPERTLLGFLFTVCVGLFLTNRYTVAYFWNRRADRLAKGPERELWTF